MPLDKSYCGFQPVDFNLVTEPTRFFSMSVLFSALILTSKSTSNVLDIVLINSVMVTPVSVDTLYTSLFHSSVDLRIALTTSLT
jgi:hypothetical protein